MAISFDYANEEIVNEFTNMVYQLALCKVKNNADAADIFQDVFLRLVKSRENFESKEHIKAWLIRVTVNCSKNLMKSAWNRYTVPLEEAPDKIHEDDFDEIHSAIKDLPLKMRMIVHLFYIEDMSADKIGKILKIKTSTVTSQLCKARKILKEKLKGEYDYE